MANLSSSHLYCAASAACALANLALSSAERADTVIAAGAVVPLQLLALGQLTQACVSWRLAVDPALHLPLRWRSMRWPT